MIKHVIYLSIALISTYSFSSEATYVDSAREWISSTKSTGSAYMQETALPFMKSKWEAAKTLAGDLKTRSSNFMNGVQTSATPMVTAQPEMVAAPSIIAVSDAMVTNKSWIESQPAWMQSAWTFVKTHPIKLAAGATAMIAAGIFVKIHTYQHRA